MNRKLGNDAQMCGIQRVTADGGRGDGEHLLYVHNGKLHFVLSLSHALDIPQLWHEGTNMSFVSKNGLYSRKDEFLNTFPGGMLYTCGFDALGRIEGHPVHGRLHSIPAELISAEADETGVKIVAEIRQTSLIGENMVLRRTVETAYGEGALHLTDVVTNCAFRDEKYCMLYHINAGYPLCDEGAEVVADIAECTPRDAAAAKCADTVLRVEAPVDEEDEMCYRMKLRKPEISLVNRRLGKKFTVQYNDDFLSHLVEWKDRDSQCYVMAFEPCTSWMEEEFSYKILPSGQSITNKVTLKFENISH